MNTVGVTDYTNWAPPKRLRRRKGYVQLLSKIGKYLLNVHKMGDADLQCVSNHYAKFYYKVKNTVAVTD